MEEKQINKYLRRQFAPLGWTLVVYYLMMNVLVIGVMVADSVYQKIVYGQVDEAALSGNAWGYTLTVALGYLILRLWKKKAFWRDQVWAKGSPMSVETLLFLICLGLGIQFTNSILVTIMESILNKVGLSLLQTIESASGQSDSFSMFLYASFLAPISEELLFRGFIQRTLMPYGKKFAILGSAFLFGLFHGNLVQIPYAFLTGLLWGYVAAEYSIAWTMVLHMFNNLVLADMMDRLTRGLPEELSLTMNAMLILTGFVASIVVLVSKRKKIGWYLRQERLERRCVKWFFCNAGMIVLIALMVLNTVSSLFLMQ